MKTANILFSRLCNNDIFQCFDVLMFLEVRQIDS